ncbi:MAG: hypothetical protein IIX70_05160 [Oscillospiraceae bacterium]|nr:hypothetical protein [Oscillospiraceae bacterium]
MKNNVAKDPQKAAMNAVEAFVDPSSKKSDPQGSYTGNPVNKKEVPVQDVDDL